ncbi:hypothetical protein A3193_18575 [Candidatus Thiodiazotropha endoloripes]|uniref:hypothetical protein n=1 Tax=Candidatus Thiodiazotropha endoloripes TaxID=1818881 RepID=UPI00083CC320|nr:hypothetical protein [Candidatus Thiodiazotropha endoloripes]ODB82754.1 hypothetical protein A3193_18575 [Candidatus Thiodiazotropha endoloripes]
MTTRFTSLELDEASPENHQYWIELAQDGSVEAAKVLMAEAAIYLQHKQLIPEPLNSYIGKALIVSSYGKNHGGKDIDRAFNIKNLMPKNKYKELLKKHLLCLEIQYAFLQLGRYKSSTKDKGAYEHVADMYGYNDVDTVRKIFSKRKSFWKIKESTKEKLEILIPQYREVTGRHIL